MRRSLVSLYFVAGVVGHFPCRPLLLQVLSSTRIALFVKSPRDSYAAFDGEYEPLNVVAIDTGAGAVEIKPEDGGLKIGAVLTGVENNQQASSSQHTRTLCLGSRGEGLSNSLGEETK